MMKHLALIILLLFGLYSLAFGAFAVDGVDDPAAVDGVGSPAAVDGVEGITITDACSDCPDTSIHADIICEDWSGTALCDSGDNWASHTAGSSSLDASKSHSDTYNCSDRGSYAAEFTVVNTDDAYYEKTSLSDIGDVWMIFDVNVTSHTDVNVDDRLELAHGVNSSNVPAFAIFLSCGSDSGGQCTQLKLVSKHVYSGWQYNDLQNISTNTWYTVKIKWNNTATNITIHTGTAGGTLTERINETAAARTVDKIQVGNDDTWDENNEGTEDMTVEIDRIMIDDDAYPPECS